MMPARPTLLLMFVLAAITAIGPVSMQIFLPALPAIQDDFRSTPGIVQLTLSLSMAAMAVTTLMYGPLSDRFGRRPVLIAALVAFLAGTLACLLAPTVEALILGRVLQAGGVAAGMVLARAIVRDVYEHDRVASVLALLTAAMVVAPMVAPAIGGLLTDAFGWRANFAFVGILGLPVTLLVAVALAETNRHRTPRVSVRTMIGGFGGLLRAPVFRAYAFQAAFSTAIFFAFASGAPYVVVKVMGRPASEYGIWFVLVAVAFMIGNLTAARISRRVGGDRMIMIGSIGALASAVISAGALAAGWWVPLSLFGPGMLLGYCQGLALPNSQAGVVNHAPQAAGAASGLSGFLQMMIGAAFAQTVGVMQDGTPYPLVALMTLAAVISLGVFALRGRTGSRVARA